MDVHIPSPVHLHAPQAPAACFLPRMPLNVGDVCPITQVAIIDIADACLALDGYVYDRAALEQWLRTSNLSPMTREPLAPRRIAEPAFALRARRQAPLRVGRRPSRSSNHVVPIVVGSIVVGSLAGPLGIFIYNLRHENQIPAPLGVLAGLIGAAVCGVAAFYVDRRVWQYIQHHQSRGNRIALSHVGQDR